MATADDAMSMAQSIDANAIDGFDVEACLLAATEDIRRLRAEVERMRPVVSAAETWRDAFGGVSGFAPKLLAIERAVDLYRAAQRQPT